MMKFLKKHTNIWSSAFILVLSAWASESQAAIIDVSHPEVGVDHFAVSGNIVAIWEAFDTSNNVSVIEASIFNFSSQTWSSPVTLSDVLANSSHPHLVVANGQAIAIWTTQNAVTGTNAIFAATSITSSGNWSSATQLTAPGGAEHALGDYRVDLNPTGTAMATWGAYLTPNTTTNARANYMSNFGTWNGPVTIF